METLTLVLAWYMIFIISSTFHEAAHAFAALKLGDPTAYHGGQVTLNPVPHIQRSPLGMIVIPLLSFFWSDCSWMMGWASCPYDPYWAQSHPKKSAYMSLAGPVANLVLVLVAALAIRLGIMAGWFYQPDSVTMDQITLAHEPGLPTAFALLLSVLFTLNLVLFTFNLIPLPPLDGSGLLPLFVSAQTANRYQQLFSQPTYSLIGLFIAWQIFGLLFSPIYTFALNLLYLGSHYS